MAEGSIQNMKLLAKLEKNKIFWYLLGLSLIFFLLRLPSLIEPNWYGDEGIYQVVGLAISKGRLLYSQIWDNKPPLLYIVYAIFNGDQFRVRLFSMLSGLFATWTFFYLAQSIFKQLKASVISTLFFVLIFATPILEGNIANAENFMLLLTILSGLLVYKISAKRQTRNSKTKKLIGVGLILGIAFMFKIVAIFDLGAFLVYLIIFNIKEFKIKNTELWSKKDQLLPLVINVCFVLLGFLIPLFATSIFFISKHAFSDFTTAVFFSNVGYVGYGNK
ncbi:MAG TPA: glycosyltransferase family 39 protein, partial [Candidatus Saccharimonadales bacterium]|nr:glycosyltransferase family 39 protein [Candidatus Saccharimonadales bacterium]